MSELKICANEECGAEFVAIRSDKLYCCPNCRLSVGRKREAERQREERRKDKESLEKIKPRKRKKPKESIAEIDAKARKEGLSYGKYMEKYGLYGG
jgi:hypothetical protein